MKNVILTGMMGCGKTTCGRLLAQALDMDFVDTDGAIEEKAGLSIPEIFAQQGEDAFRRMEVETARALAGRDGLVVSCGGGLPLREEAMAPLKGSGTVIFLERDPAEIFDQVSMAGRPLGQGSREEFLQRYARREPVYRRWAEWTAPSQATPKETVALILQKLRGEGIL